MFRSPFFGQQRPQGIGFHDGTPSIPDAKTPTAGLPSTGEN
jgi:hypothetical protein